MSVYSLDVETRPLDPRLSHCAGLEPWRLRQGKAEISSMAICRPDNSTRQIINRGGDWKGQVTDFLSELQGKSVYAHFAPFDVAWLIGTLEPRKFKQVPRIISSVQWRDTSLLAKWLINGQKPENMDFSYSLVNLVQTFLPDHPLTAEFIKIKSQKFDAGQNEAYWEERGLYDVILTKALGEKLQELLPEEQRVGLMTEFACIVPVANGWMNGIKIAVEDIEKVEAELDRKMVAATSALQIAGTVLNSPKQLSNMLFNQWGLRPLNMGKTGGSTARDDLMMIQYAVQGADPVLAKKMNHVMEYKTNATLKSKYIKTLREALAHTGDGFIYGVPRVFATYTGRMSYSNTTYKDGPKVSIALHQIPRKAKEIRSLLSAPEGIGIIEDDASGQESRLIAIRSGDPTMLQVFNDGKNLHSMTGSAIIGMDYEEFMTNYKKEDGEGYYTEQRQLGKLTNLSSNFRIGGKALAQKAFTKYDTYMPDETGYFLVNTFKRQYPGVPEYWDDAIQFAKTMGYTEAFGGRRYKICEWGGQDSWSSESSALMFPIQGGGAAMKEIAIAVLFKKFPEAFFCLDLHDATFSYGERDRLKELEQDMLSCLNGIDYKSYWGFKPACPLTYESMSGLTFKDIK